MSYLTIGQVAKVVEAGVETIRFYEREGLIGNPPRTAAGYRQYSPEAVQRLKFIRRAKDLGFTLKEIRELLTMRTEVHTTCEDIRQFAEEKIENIDTKIRMLVRIKEALKTLTKECDGSSPAAACPILEAMAREDP